MIKTILLLRAPPAQNKAAFRELVFETCVPALLGLNPAGLKVGLTEPPRPGLTVLPLREYHLAIFSVWSANDSQPAEALSGKLPEGVVLSGYRIDESVPVAYEKTWQDGETSPGIVLLTLLKQNPKLSYEDFMHEWHGRHTPKAMRIHPFWNYIRNVIVEPVVEGSPVFEGIVEEHFRTRGDCINPVRMFGGPLRFIPHMVEVGLHAKHFLDLSLTENYLLSETWIRSPDSSRA